MLYTSYFAKLKKLKEYDIVPIAICGKSPDWYDGLQYKKLAPKKDFFLQWKQNHDNNFYIEHFDKEVLDTLDPKQVLDDLYALARQGKDNDFIPDIALICYEKTDDFCHRHRVADWFNKNNIEIKEWKE